MSCSWYHTR